MCEIVIIDAWNVLYDEAHVQKNGMKTPLWDPFFSMFPLKNRILGPPKFSKKVTYLAKVTYLSHCWLTDSPTRVADIPRLLQ